MTLPRDRVHVDQDIGEESTSTAAEGSDLGALSALDALSAQVGGGDMDDAPDDAGISADDDAKLDLGAIAHSSMPRAPQAVVPRDDAEEDAESRAADVATTAAKAVAKEPTFAVSVRLFQGAALGFCAGLLAGWVLFAGTPSPAVSPPSAPEPAIAEVSEVASNSPDLPQAPGGTAAAPVPSVVAPPPIAAAAPPVLEGPASPAVAGPTAAAARSTKRQPSGSPRRPVPSVVAAPPTAESASTQVLTVEPVEPAVPDVPNAPTTMDSLLDDALDRRPGAEPEPPPVPDVPQAPSQADVSNAIRVLIPAISGCAAAQKGVAVVSLVVRSTGRVASARISGAPFEGTPAGRCMEGVVRKARFPRFARPTFRVQLPLKIE